MPIAKIIGRSPRNSFSEDDSFREIRSATRVKLIDLNLAPDAIFP